MITFKTFISEEKSFNLEKFKKDCDFVLKELAVGGGKKFLLHGTRNEPKGDYEIRQFKERTGPRDSSKNLHDMANEFFQERFGVKARNWMFTTGDIAQAKLYSPNWDGVLAIFPIGKFEWISALDPEAYDLTSLQSQNHTKVYLQSNDKQRADDEYVNREADKLTVGAMKHFNWKHNDDLIECLKSNNEIMMKCDRFYAFKVYGETFTNIIKPMVQAL